MTEENEAFSLEDFDSNTSFAIGMLRCDIGYIEKQIAIAKSKAPDRELEIRREIRPLAVELLYTVIGTPKTFEDALSDMEEQEDEDGK